MASLQRSSRLVWIPLSFAIYTSSCFSAGRKEQCPRTCVTPTSSRSTRPKDKGHRSDCNTHRGISLLSITGKAFARVVCNRLQKLAKRVYPEARCGFKAGRTIIDMIFSLRRQEKCREQRKSLCIAFIDLSKAFEPNQLEGVIHSLAEDWMPSQAPKDDNVFPWRHARNRPVGWLNLRPLPNQERSKTGPCTCTHTLGHLFFCTAVLRL